MLKKESIIRITGRFLFYIGRVLLAGMILSGMILTHIPTVQAENADTATISGIVQDIDGNPIEGIYVYAEDYAASTSAAWAISDNSGYYELLLVPGAYRVRACPACLDVPLPYANQYVGESGGTLYWNLAKKLTLASAGEVQTQNFSLQPGGSISGTVRDASDTPIAGLAVVVVDQNNEWIDSNTTLDDGSYTIAGLPATNTLYVYACADCNVPSPYLNMYYDATGPVYALENARPITISAGEETSGLNFALQAGNSISGWVQDTNDPALPLGGITVGVINWDTNEWIQSVETAPDGSYTLSRLLDGDYRVQACPECAHQAYLSRYYNNTPNYDAAMRLTLSGGETVSGINFTLDPAAVITGKITDQSSGLPLAHIPVYAENTQDYQGFGTESDNQGMYAVNVKPGYYRLQTTLKANADLTHYNYVDEIYDSAANIENAKVIDAQVNTIFPGYDFQLEEGGTLTGGVEDEAGMALSGASVMAVPLDGTSRSFASQDTGINGAFILQGLPAGPYVLRAMHPGRKAQFYNDQPDWGSANRVTITAGNTTSGIEFRLPIETGEDPELDSVRQAMLLPGGYDPSLSSFVAEVDIIDQIFAGLTRINPENGKTINNLVSSWQSADSQVWSFTLRDGLKWSDGSALSAEDLRFGILRGLRVDQEHKFLYNLLMIQGATEYNQGKVSAGEVGITVTDPTHVTFTLTQPASFFPTLLATSSARPLPQLLVQAYPDSWLDPSKLITSGPYKLVEYRAEHAVLKKNDNFIDKDQVKIQQVEILNASPNDAWNLFTSGKLDTAAVPTSKIPLIKADEVLSHEFVQVKQQCTSFLGLNTDGLGSNQPVKLRQALIEAIDRDQYNLVFDDSLPTAWTFIPPGVLGHSDPEANIHLPYNPTQALADIIEAYDGNAQGLPPLTLYYQTDVANAENLKAGMDYLAATWNQTLNGKFSVQGITINEYEDKLVHRELAVWRRGWCSDYQDGYNFLSSLIMMRDLYGNWDTAAYEASLAQAASSLDEDTRVGLYRGIEEQLLKTNAMLMPLNYTISPMLTRGFIRSYGIGGVDYIADWDFDRSDSTTLGSASNQRALAQAAETTSFTPIGERGTISYEIPVNAFSGGITLTHTGHLTNDLTQLPAGMQNTAVYFSIQAENSAHTPVNPIQDYSLDIQYSQEEISANSLRESSLALYYWDDNSHRWEKDANSVVDPATNRITTHTRRLGDWVVLGGEEQDLYLFLPLVVR
jgi:ABC-type oligopeptide transport system substrate-binding subunit